MGGLKWLRPQREEAPGLGRVRKGFTQEMTVTRALEKGEMMDSSERGHSECKGTEVEKAS